MLRVHTHKIMSTNLGVGSRLPAFWTSMGRVLLVALPPDELRALMAALNRARSLGARSLTVRTDSHVLLEQLGPPLPKPARPIARLSHLFEEARASMQGFDELVLQWVPRHRNIEADALARAAHSATA